MLLLDSVFSAHSGSGSRCASEGVREKRGSKTGGGKSIATFVISTTSPFALLPLARDLLRFPKVLHSTLYSLTAMASTQQKPSLVQRELKKGVNLLKEDASSVGALASEAARSGAYLYPLYAVSSCARVEELTKVRGTGVASSTSSATLSCSGVSNPSSSRALS